MQLKEISTAVDTLPGIGKATASLFSRLNIFTVADLLSSYPRDYEDRSKKIPLADFSLGKVHTIAQVTEHKWFGYGAMKTLKIAISDGSAKAYLTAFGRPFLAKSLPEGSIIAVTGRFEQRYGELQSSAFEAERIAYSGDLKSYENEPIPSSGVLPIYSLTEGLSQKIFRKTVAQALKLYGKAVDDELPQELIKRKSFLHKSEALLKIHKPASLSDIEEARKTLIFEELYDFEIKIGRHTLARRGTLPTLSQSGVFEKGQAQRAEKDQFNNASPSFETPGISKEEFEKALSPSQKELLRRLPFELTEGQMAAVAEINRDIDRSQSEWNTIVNKNELAGKNPFSMSRLLQGDVGSGKTLVSFLACLRSVDYGGQCALLAPTELLARQHAENAAKLLSVLGISVAFLTGNVKAKNRPLLLNALKEGKIDIVVGTHALFGANVNYKNLSLAVIDEQHRFGVTQREAILAKGRVSSGAFSRTPDLLMMSATPIPQTLALSAFGDLDISTIRTMPSGRKQIKTYLSVMGHENNAYQAVRKELEAGHQAYFVYPRIQEEEGDGSLKSAQEMFKFLSEKVYPDFKTALVHSQIDEDESHKILDDFAKGEIKVLVATTVVEVGVDVPNATCIVIEHADRFGLAELHQLRGRVGRNSLQSYCFLIYSKNISPDGVERMKALRESCDGFEIAEKDLKLRGPGQLSGTQQSGYLDLNIADLARDKDMLLEARYEAFKYLTGLK